MAFDWGGDWGKQIAGGMESWWPKLGNDAPGIAPPQAAPAPDPALATTQQQRVKEASDFRSNLPGMERDLGTTLENTGRRQLATDVATNKMTANRRGLLGSGMNQAQDAMASGRAAVGLAQGKQQLSDQLQNQADVMEQAAINNGYQYWQSAKGLADSAYNQALSNMMSERSKAEGFIGVASKVGGIAAGGGFG